MVKKAVIFGIILLLSLSFVLAVENNSDDNSAKCKKHYWIDDTNKSCGLKEFCGLYMYEGLRTFKTLDECIVARMKNNSGIGQELREQIKIRKQEIKSGNYTAKGKLLNVREIVEGLKELRVNRSKINSRLNITIETVDNETVLRVERNGTEKEIKIMPDTAADRAIERLKLKVCNETNNCTIELKSVGQKIKYILLVQRHYKILALFKAKALNHAEVDAETGEVSIKKPWWAFLAKSN